MFKNVFVKRYVYVSGRPFLGGAGWWGLFWDHLKSKFNICPQPPILKVPAMPLVSFFNKQRPIISLQSKNKHFTLKTHTHAHKYIYFIFFLRKSRYNTIVKRFHSQASLLLHEPKFQLWNIKPGKKKNKLGFSHQNGESSLSCCSKYFIY